MDREEKVNILQKFNEKQLTQKFLIRLFQKMGFRNVVYRHGVLEYGKDVVYCEETKFRKLKYVGVQVKSGDINSAIADKIFSQIARGLSPFADLSDNSKEKAIDEFIILSSGEIKEHARENISKMMEGVQFSQPISFIDGNELVDLLDEYLPSAFWDEYDHFSKYLNAMKQDFETIREVTAIGQKEPILLENIYVSLKLTEKVREREVPIEKGRKVSEKEREIFEEEFLEREEVKRRVERERILDADRAVKDYDKLVIVGAPGSGKTTLLKHLALKTCKQNLEKQERTCVPIPITLRELAESGKRLRKYVDEIFEKYRFPKAKEFVEKDLKDGKCQLLLDGFDELATKERQEKVSQEIREFLGKYPRCRTVVTSRIAGYHDELKGFTKLELMEFDDKQIMLFIENWFGETGPEKADSMYRAIKENERIKALARNPLMIAIIAIIYEEDRKLPQRRADLYKRCVEVLLSKWDKQKRLKNKYPPDKKEFILRKLAYYGHGNNKRVMTEKEIMGEMLKYFPQIGVKRDDAKPFIDEIWQRSYLLRQISMESYDFLHLSFQEYFTALELKDREDGTTTIMQRLLDPWWEEPILLYAGISKDATVLIRRIQQEVPEDIFYSNLMLFGKCIADAEFTEPDLREAIVNDLWCLCHTADISSLKDKAIQILALIRPDSIIDSLIKQWNYKENDLRCRAAEALGYIRSEKAVDSLIKALATDEESGPRRSAAEALARIGSERAIRPLIKALVTSRESEIRREAAEALERIGSEKATEPLIAALANDESTYVRRTAADALGRIGSEEAIDPLIEALVTNEEGDVHWRAAEALGRIGGEKALNPLINVLNNEKESDILGRAAFALGRIGGEKALDPLIKTLRAYTGSYVRSRAAEALGRIGSEKAVDPLIKALTTDEESEPRRSAAEALGRIGSERAIKPLIKALVTSRESEIRWRAAEALGRIGSEEGLESLLKALTAYEESHVRWMAAEALGRIGSKEAMDPLIETLTSDEDYIVRGKAAEALGRIGDEKAIEPLIKTLITDEESLVQVDAAEALGSIGGEKAIKSLKRALKDEGEWAGGKVKDAAFEALERISRRNKIRILKQPD